MDGWIGSAAADSSSSPCGKKEKKVKKNKSNVKRILNISKGPCCVCQQPDETDGQTDAPSRAAIRHSNWTTQQNNTLISFYFIFPSNEKRENKKRKENLNFIFFLFKKKSAKKKKKKQETNEWWLSWYHLSIAGFIASNYLSSLSLNRIVGRLILEILGFRQFSAIKWFNEIFVLVVDKSKPRLFDWTTM